MLKQIADKKIQDLEVKLETANLIIQELLGALSMKDSEVRNLIRDVAIEYLNGMKEVFGD